MSVIVVATFTPVPGAGSRIIDAFRRVSPLVHNEVGCELYAAHIEQQGDAVVMVEQWSSREALEAHAAGAPLRSRHSHYALLPLTSLLLILFSHFIK